MIWRVTWEVPNKYRNSKKLWKKNQDLSGKPLKSHNIVNKAKRPLFIITDGGSKRVKNEIKFGRPVRRGVSKGVEDGRRPPPKQP
jgi:hypothetical protein